jgi:UDP-N-acetylmuramate: L-alanyl-gamma-D-glutamyl-meso-diaminopimelate ligase
MRQEALNLYREKTRSMSDGRIRLFSRNMPERSDAVRTVHIIGICGTAMASLAGLLKERGFSVTGSDTACYPPMSDMIRDLGIPLHEGYAPEHIGAADLVVVGNAAGPLNPEAAAARERSLPQLSLPEAIELFFLAGKTPLVVAGTHGKTTTTGMLAHVFSEAGLEPGYLVGGVPAATGRSFSAGKGQHFIIEGDEYDSAYFDKSPKFLHYRPASAVVTSLEFDHADIYRDLDEYAQAFRLFVAEIPAEGNLFLHGDDPNVAELGGFANASVRTYGFNPENPIRAEHIRSSSEGQTFELWIDGITQGEIFLPLSGRHNVLNALAVCGMSMAEGMQIEALAAGLRTFRGMRRRQETVAEGKGITVIDDFAHHPTAVRETIAAMRERYPGRRLVALFEPRSNTSRRKIFEESYGRAFDAADLVCLSVPPLRHNDNPDDFLNADSVAAALKGRGIEAESFETPDALFEAVVPKLRGGDVVLMMSNGSFGGLREKFVAWLA